MPTFVTVEDVATYLGAPVNNAQTEQLLDMAESLVLAEFAEPVPAPGPSLHLLRHATMSATARALRSPEGFTSETVGAYTYRRDRAGLYLTDEERAAIRAARVASSGVPYTSAYSIPVTTPADRNYDPDGHEVGW